MTPREAAYQAVLASMQGKGFVSDRLFEWERSSLPNQKDLKLAWEIANGTVRMALALDHYALQCSGKSKLSLKNPERALLRTALYQHLYMTKVPLYAIVDETVSLAKRFFHRSFAGFLNAQFSANSPPPALRTSSRRFS